MSKASEVLMPSMADITFEDGVQIGGVNKSYIDVAFDFSFSVAADNLKEYGLPNTKISGNPFIKSFKDGILDFGVDQTQKRIQDTNTGTPSSINPNGNRYTARVKSATMSKIINIIKLKQVPNLD